MKTTYETVQANVNETDRRNRCKSGFQCPECHGVRIIRRTDKHSGQFVGFGCNECGCNWDKKVYP